MHPHILQQVPTRAQTEETFSILLGVFHTTLDFLQRLDLSHFCLPESTDWKLETDAAFSLKKNLWSFKHTRFSITSGGPRSCEANRPTKSYC